MMTVGELRKKLEGLDDNMKVLIPVSQEFDGAFYSPCSESSGKTVMGTDSEITEEEAEEASSSNTILIDEETNFVLFPCGYFEEADHTHELN